MAAESVDEELGEAASVWVGCRLSTPRLWRQLGGMWLVFRREDELMHDDDGHDEQKNERV